MKETKKKKVLEHLIKYGTISSLEAFQYYNATRLSAIIFNLRKEGYVIENNWEESTNKFGEKSRYVRYELLTKEKYFEMNDAHISHID